MLQHHVIKVIATWGPCPMKHNMRQWACSPSYKYMFSAALAQRSLSRFYTDLSSPVCTQRQLVPSSCRLQSNCVAPP